LDLKQQDLFGQSPSVSESRSAKPSSESTGPTRPSTTTLEPSRQMNLEESTSSQVDFLASHSRWPGSASAQKMTAISGRRWLPLLKSYGLNGSLAKMSEALLTSRWASSAAFLTWKASGIKSPHLLFQLAPSMPRTDEIGSGLLHTPRSCSAMAAQNIQNRVDDKFRNLESVVARTMWPTPTAPGKHQVGTIGEWGGSGNPLRTPETMRLSGGSLNPTWVEWLMGFPTGWTDLEASETQSSPRSSSKSDGQ